MKIVCATAKEQAYAIAAEEFKKYFNIVTGETAEISVEDDGVSDLAIIGTAAVNGVLAAKELDDEIQKLPVRTGTDDHAIKLRTLGARKILLLQGGNARSTLYAVYAYFETIGCAWFWDGDVVPKKNVDELLKIEVDAYFKERFIYRGIRYFAHRGCKRFQAEMWDFNDWKKEIDYLVKRKINLFMLRIGQDDLFQRTFPSAVKYPTKRTMSDLCYQNEAWTEDMTTGDCFGRLNTGGNSVKKF